MIDDLKQFIEYIIKIFTFINDSSSKYKVEVSENEIKYYDNNEKSSKLQTNNKTILDDIFQRSQKYSIFNFGIFIVVIIAIGIYIFLHNTMPDTIHVVTVIPSLITTCIGFLNLKKLDVSRKDTQINYEITSGYSNIFNNINLSISELHKSKQILFLEGKKKNLEAKHNFGYDTLPILKEVTIKLDKPPHINVNIDVWHIHCSNADLYFLPDQILLYSNSLVSGLKYSELIIKTGLEEVIWEGNVKITSDCKVTDKVWKYINKDGTQDKRFNNNYNLPIIEYGVIEFSISGINLKFYVSDQAISAIFKNKFEMSQNLLENNLTQQKLINEQPKIQNDYFIHETINFSDEEAKTIINIMCCIAFADGKFEESELKAFMYILKNCNIKLNESKTKKYITQFYNLIKENSFSYVLNNVCESIKIIKEQEKKDLIMHHLDTIVMADNNFHKNEKIVYDKIKEILYH